MPRNLFIYLFIFANNVSFNIYQSPQSQTTHTICEQNLLDSNCFRA